MACFCVWFVLRLRSFDTRRIYLVRRCRMFTQVLGVNAHSSSANASFGADIYFYSLGTGYRVSPRPVNVYNTAAQRLKCCGVALLSAYSTVSTDSMI